MPSSKLDQLQPLTPTFERERCPYNAKQIKSEAQQRAENEARAARRESFMVKRQQARPVARPSHALATGPDRAAFNAQWRQEQRAAEKEQSRDALKAEFKAQRGAQGRVKRQVQRDK